MRSTQHTVVFVVACLCNTYILCNEHQLRSQDVDYEISDTISSKYCAIS
jgi:hypothetical protein